MTKVFNIHAEKFTQIAATMKAFEKVYSDSIETMYFGQVPTIVLKEEGGVKNIFRFTTKEFTPGVESTMDISDFIKHYFPDPRKNPLA